MLPKKSYLQFKRAADGTVFGRFSPSPKLRKMGYGRFNICTGGDPYSTKEWAARGFKSALPITKPGHYASIEDCLDIMDEVLKVIEAQSRAAEPLDVTAAARKPKHRSAARTASALTVRSLFNDYLRSPEFLDDCSSATQRDYRNRLHHVANYFGTRAPADIDSLDVYEMYKSICAHGKQHAAHRQVAVMRIAFGWGRKKSRRWKPFIPDIDFKLGLPKPAPRIRIATPAEQAALMRAADDPYSIYKELGRSGPFRKDSGNGRSYPAQPTHAMHSVADMLTLMIWTAMRPTDALLANWDWCYTHNHTQDPESRRRSEGPRLTYSPSKTGKKHNITVDIPILPPLQKRLAEIRMRQLANDWRGRGRVLLTDTYGKPYATSKTGSSTFSTNFSKVRSLAAEIEPSVATLHAQDYRDTALTQLARGGASLLEILAFSAHSSLDSLKKVIEHYMQIDGEFADRAGKKLMKQMGY